MATTFKEQVGDGDATVNFTFPSYQSSDVKVRVDGVLKTAGNHYNIINYTTTGGGDVVFTSGNIPSSPALIRIYRDTNVDVAKATFTAGSSVKAADLNNNNTQLLYRAQEEQIPNLIHSYDIDDGAITTDKIVADAITSAKLADDSVNSEHYVDGSIDTAHIADAQITTAKLAADSVTNAKIADDSINSEHYVDGSIDTAHIADAQITTAKVADGAITSAKLASGTVATGDLADGLISTAKIAADAVTNAKIADDSIDSEHYVDGSIDTAHIGNLQVTTAKIANDAVTTEKIADNAVRAAQIHNGEVTNVKLANDAVTAAKIANNAVTTDKIADSELTTLAGMQSATASKLADSTALTADIADLNQIDGMQKATTVTDDDTKFPTSGAIVDYVAAQLEPFGGFEAIANESSFPNTRPASGVAISIADAGGMAVSSTGTASGATVGGTTVNISGIPSNFRGTTIDNGVRFIVTSTGSGQNYTYHKATLKEDDLLNLSGDINDFSERYRVGSSNPTTGLDNGDLFFNTGSGKLLVYNGTNSAWEETQSVGNFFINTISSSSNTGGGSATPNGTAYRFTISNAGANAEQHLVSVDGVIQKPNSGTSQPSEGFALDGGDIIFGSAPVNGASLFVITIGASVGIGTPSNNTVTSAILQNGSVTTAKIVDANVTAAKIANGAVTAAKIDNGTIITNNIADGAVTAAKIDTGTITTAKIADDAVTAAKLADTSVTAGSYGSSTSIPSITVDAQGRITAASGNSVNTDLVGDTSPQLGGNLDTNGSLIIFPDSNGATNRLIFGTSKFQMLYDSGNSRMSLDNNTGDMIIRNTGSGGDIDIISSDDIRIRPQGGENGITLLGDGAVELYYDNSKKFETYTAGVSVTGTLTVGAGNIVGNDNAKLKLGSSDDLQVYHDGTNSHIENNTNALVLRSDAIRINNNANSETMIKSDANGAVELYYDNNKSCETTTEGLRVTDGTGSTAALEVKATGTNRSDVRILATGSGDAHLWLDAANGDLSGGDYATIYHSNSSGNLNIVNYANDMEFYVRGGSVGAGGLRKAAHFYNNGSVALYHNGNHVLSTVAEGIQLQTDKILTRHPNSNQPMLKGTNSQYAVELRVGGWEGGTNTQGIVRIRNSNDNLHMDAGGNGEMYLNAYCPNSIRSRHFRPLADNTYDLGNSSLRWDDVYATNSNIVTSDKNKKNTIVDSDLGLSFINKLKPVSYKFNDGTRTHYGLIAQDVETVLSDISKPTTGFAGFVKTDLPDEYYQEAEPHIPEGKNEGDLKSAAHTEYGLRYEEFISPLIKAVQELSAKVAALEAA